MDTDNWITAVLALRKAERIVVFTGAGISASSGIPTFRDTDGFWNRFPPEQFATWDGLLKTALTRPHQVAEFVLNVVAPIAKAHANAAHRAVSRIERHTTTTVVTQNVDGLHQAAGSTHVHEIHGSLLEVIDTSTQQVIKRFQRDELIRISETLEKYTHKKISLVSFLWELRQCFPFDWRGRHRPNLILFGDALAEPAWTEACQAADQCDLLLTVGTSAAVYPAAMLPDRASKAGATTITIDPHVRGECWLQGNSETILPKLVSDAFGPAD
ncbi:SIR2 family NAD-dependent protein deacylase [Schlesneria paludicola]|uniref:SIR2 family NAD-dependent protein deacylase n=1 Tax=Schlesneria paludicola TaxID=360056 RepID=UPI00029A1770|nr:Sir2 family NAD-dependent protein deacetylase [Schlesneria paludicola]